MFNKQIRRNMKVYVDDMLVKSKEESATWTISKRCSQLLGNIR